MEVLSIKKNTLLKNNEIRDREVRLIDADGTMLGVMNTTEAQKLAFAKNLDLVKIVPGANPPVCKIIDYNKSIFEKAKRDKEAKKKQKAKASELKEVRLSATIEDHDFNFKVKNAIKFLQDGNKVKASIRFKGRQIRFSVTGQDVMAKFAESVKDAGTVDRQPKLVGRSMTMILVPKK